jgi:lysozyme
METSKIGIDLITHFEGIKVKPYLCPANVVTISIGVVLLDEKGNQLKGKEGLEKSKILYPELQEISIEKALELFKNTLKTYEKDLNSLKLELSQNQFDALVSFIYNVGFSAFKTSTLLKRIKDKKGDITEAFLM